MDAEAIKRFNASVATKFRLAKIATYEDNVTGRKLKSIIQSFSNSLMKRNLYVDRVKLTKEYYTELMKIVDFKKIGDEVPVRFGIVVKNTSQRVIPTSDVLVLGKNGSVHFDRNQMSSLECATPVVILVKTTDKKWLYVRSSHTEGWVPTDSIAFCTRADVARWEDPSALSGRFAVVVRMKAPIYLNEAMTDYYGWLPMGNKLVMSKDGQLFMPMRGVNGRLVEQQVYVQPEYIHEGFVPYTSRNMLNLAFEMLNAPYGWGGMYGEQDCSSFLMKVFAAAGVLLPRNSAQQGNTGMTVFTKNTAVLPATDMTSFFGVPGSTLIQFPGHVMLYIGSEQGKPYVIHAMWAYVEEDTAVEEEIVEAVAAQDNSTVDASTEELAEAIVTENADPVPKRPKLIVRSPARVVVSHLELSPASEDGAYYERIANVRNIDAPAPVAVENETETSVAAK
jgi:hypothetical protein